MKVIGITGRVGSGKSEILNYLEKHYPCILIRADEVAKELQKPGAKCFDAVVSCIGSDCLDKNGGIDKAKMAEVIFNDPDVLEKVNSIVHPAVKESILEQIGVAREDGKSEYVFLEAALLLEAGYRDICDEIWNIRVEESVRRERLKASRGYSDEKIDSILSKQLGEDEFDRLCDVTFDNSGDLEKTTEKIDEYLRG